MYMQVLEGPERAVLGLYLKILDDRRHGGGQLIYITPTKERIFEAWSMVSLRQHSATSRYACARPTWRARSGGLDVLTAVALIGPRQPAFRVLPGFAGMALDAAQIGQRIDPGCGTGCNH